MKKNNLIFAISLCSVFANAQTISNGNFESFSSLPTCPSNFGITKAASWNGLKTTYGPNNCTTYTDVMGVSSNVSYFNQSIGGTASCQSGAPRTGNGYVVCQARGMYGGTAFDELIFQAVSGTLTSGTQYQYRAYASANPKLGAANAYLVNQNVGSSASAIMNDVRSQANATPQTPLTITGTTGWIKYEKILTVPTTGNYYLVIGDMFLCNDWANSTLFGYSIDDVEFGKKCADAGSNKCTLLPGNCCGGSPSSVQIGTPAISGYSYSWQPTTYLSSSTIAQPIANPIVATTYTLTVTGSTPCILSTSTVTVTPSANCNGASSAPCCSIGKLSQNTELRELNNLGLDFNIYPNPANSNINITLNNLAENIKITDLAGKIVFETKNITELELTINISKFSKGIYFISASSGLGIQRKKLIIE